MSCSVTPSANGVSSSAPDPGNASEELQEIQPFPSTSIEDLCLSRPGGLPIIKDLKSTDAIVFYYGQYQPEYGSDKGTRKGSGVEDVELHPGDGVQEFIEVAKANSMDTQSPTIQIASEIPRAKYRIVPLAAMTSPASTVVGNNPWPNNGGAHVQITYIQTFAKEEINKLFDSSCDVECSNTLFQIDGDGRDPLMSAVTVRAGKQSYNIFVGLPYLGCGPETNSDSIPQDGIKNGLKLSSYRGIEGDAKEPDYGVRVWQSWQILLDNTRLALIKSPVSPSSNCAPLFAHQPTWGPLHALALNIGNQLRHEVQPLEVLRATVDDDLSNIDILLEPAKLTEDEKTNYEGRIKDSHLQLERHLSNMKTIIIVLGKQLAILRDLTTITSNNLNPPSRPASGNPVPLPPFDWQREQLKRAGDVFKQLISERETVLADMNKLCADVKKSEEELRRELRDLRKLKEQAEEKEARNDLLRLLSAQGAASANTNQTLEAQRETTKKMKEIMARQGQTISVFTFITAIFLPLGFFAQFLSMNKDVWSGVSTHEEFWRIAGPITVFVMVALIYFIYRDDDKIKLDILRITPFAGKKYKKLKQEIAHREQEENQTSRGQNEDELGTGSEAGEQRIQPSWAIGKWTSFIDWWRAAPTHGHSDLEAAPEAGG